MTMLKMAFHSTTGRRIVEVIDDSGKVVGCIYPTEDGSNGVHVVSKYFDGPPAETAGTIPIPGVLIKFKKPYT